VTMHAPFPSDAPRARAIAFYLPQFHPIPENDEWWGVGFTEWTNVVTGKPRFEGHYQPHLPADLGFYDLRVQETRQAQADLARAAGIEAFCYYHYWFRGKRLLGGPIDAVLASGSPDFPFCFCWANESWSRAWSGRDHDVLISQDYDETDDAAHIAWLIGAFRDPRYLSVEGRPLFLIYKPESLPDAPQLLTRWRFACSEAGVAKPYICAVRTGFSKLDATGLRALGFDGVVEFEPNRMHFPESKNTTGHLVSMLQRLLPASWYDALRNGRVLGSRELNTIVNYEAYVDRYLARAPLAPTTYPVVFPSWDNAARRTSATIIENHDPAQYTRWLEEAVSRVAGRNPDERIVFINAWNEWAEGCHLEPDQRHGHAFLDATAAGLGLPRTASK
jgi:lipopolysaccharide biosynthesis protein